MSEQVIAELEAAGQERLAASMRALPQADRDAMSLQVASLDLALVQRLVGELVRGPGGAHAPHLGPADVDRLPGDDASHARRRMAVEA
ncbi:MAG: hypothetical protein ACPG9N_02695, partial [Miltoncostaeaceae bacterium]